MVWTENLTRLVRYLLYLYCVSEGLIIIIIIIINIYNTQIPCEYDQMRVTNK